MEFDLRSFDGLILVSSSILVSDLFGCKFDFVLIWCSSGFCSRAGAEKSSMMKGRLESKVMVESILHPMEHRLTKSRRR